MNKFKDGKLLAKHEVITIDQLVGVKDSTPVFITERNPKPFKDKWGVKGGKELPERIIIQSVGHNKTPLGEYYNIVYYYKANGYKYYQTTTLLPGYKLCKFTGTTKEYLNLKLGESMMDNLEFHLNRGNAWNLGSDPEVFVVNGKGELMPAFTFLKGKKDPDVARTDIDVYHYRDYNASTGSSKKLGKPCYWDGFQAEFETQPYGCLAAHVDHVQAGLDKVLKEARKVDPKAKLSIQTVFDIPAELLQTSKHEHVTLGCMPSLNAYGIKGKEVPDGRKMDTRSAGGHIHFEINDKSNIVPMVKALDAVIGVPCVALFASYDNPERRKYYGLAGEYRLPPHGMEYRVLSNAWLLHPFIMNIVFDLSRVGLSMHSYMKAWKGSEAEIVEIINTCDVAKAQKMMRRNKNILYKLYKAAYPNITEAQQNKLFDIFTNGMESVISNPDDIEKNWCLGTQWTDTGNSIYSVEATGQTQRWAPHNETGDKNFAKGIVTITNGKKIA